jgi:hypothetical protein
VLQNAPTMVNRPARSCPGTAEGALPTASRRYDPDLNRDDTKSDATRRSGKDFSWPGGFEGAAVLPKAGKSKVEAVEQRYGSSSTTTFEDSDVAATLEAFARGQRAPWLGQDARAEAGSSGFEGARVEAR